MKFNLNDFLQLDTNGLLAVNGGSGCSSGPSSGSSDSSGGSSSSGNSSGASSGPGSSTTETIYVPTGPYNGYLVTRTKKGSNKVTSSGVVSSSGGGSCSSSYEGVESISYQTGGSSSSGGHGCSGGGSSAPSGGNNGGGAYGGISEESAFEKILNEIYKKKNNTPEANDPGEVTGCYKIGYQCDEYVSEILSGAGFDVNEYNVDNPSGKNVNTHIEDLKKSSKKYDTDASKLNHGAYVVFMSDEQSIIDSHAALLFINNDGSAFIYDNSSRNFQVGENIYLGGIEKTGWNGSSALDVCNQYSSYEHFYFQKIK